MATVEAGRHLRACPLCEAMCGLEIRVEDGRVASIRGNRDDVWSRGHLCPKGVSLAALHDDPDRIRSPLIKVAGRWQDHRDGDQNDLYELISERATGGGSMILTSNRSPVDWYPLLPNPVVAESLLDRLIDSSRHVFMNGPSYRPNKRPGAKDDRQKQGRAVG